MTPHTTPFTILVNSSDGFEDCWDPFFKLLGKHWPGFQAPVLLNTERKTYQHDGIDIKSTVVQGRASARLTWSECLLGALAQIQTTLVLYLQEDYFIHQPVLQEKINAAAAYMLKNPEVKHIALTRFGSRGPYLPHSVDWLQAIAPRAKYRISTQAALWRVDSLRSYIVPEENGWMFEICGTWRAWRRRDCFLCVRFDDGCGGPPIDYIHTGIIKGQWSPEIRDVFARHDIRVDYSRRGFYSAKHPLLRRIETGRRVLEHPIHFLKQLV